MARALAMKSRVLSVDVLSVDDILSVDILSVNIVSTCRRSGLATPRGDC
jgi:hypothetical protein